MVTFIASKSEQWIDGAKVKASRTWPLVVSKHSVGLGKIMDSEKMYLISQGRIVLKRAQRQFNIRVINFGQMKVRDVCLLNAECFISVQTWICDKFDLQMAFQNLGRGEINVYHETRPQLGGGQQYTSVFLWKLLQLGRTDVTSFYLTKDLLCSPYFPGPILALFYPG